MVRAFTFLPTLDAAKLTLLAALGWLAIWLCLPVSFAIWLLMFGVYLGGLGLASLALAVSPRLMSSRRDRWASLFRSAEWVVLSGLISVALYLAGLLIYLRWTGQELFPM